MHATIILSTPLHEASIEERRECLRQIQIQLGLAEPPSKARKDERDELIRHLLETRFAIGPLAHRCKRLAEEWTAHVTRKKNDAALRRLTELNSGKPLGWGQIRNIAEGHRHETY